MGLVAGGFGRWSKAAPAKQAGVTNGWAKELAVAARAEAAAAFEERGRETCRPPFSNLVPTGQRQWPRERGRRRWQCGRRRWGLVEGRGGRDKVDGGGGRRRLVARRGAEASLHGRASLPSGEEGRGERGGQSRGGERRGRSGR